MKIKKEKQVIKLKIMYENNEHILQTKDNYEYWMIYISLKDKGDKIQII